MWALREISRTAPADALGYGDPRGSVKLREVLAAYLRRVRGAAADPDRIVVCSWFRAGHQPGAARARPRRRLGGWRSRIPARTTRASSEARWGLDGVAVPVDEHGIDVGGARGQRCSARRC